jgi:hypothetical protein
MRLPRDPSGPGRYEKDRRRFDCRGMGRPGCQGPMNQICVAQPCTKIADTTIVGREWKLPDRVLRGWLVVRVRWCRKGAPARGPTGLPDRRCYVFARYEPREPSCVATKGSQPANPEESVHQQRLRRLHTSAQSKGCVLSLTGPSRGATSPSRVRSVCWPRALRRSIGSVRRRGEQRIQGRRGDDAIRQLDFCRVEDDGVVGGPGVLSLQQN